MNPKKRKFLILKEKNNRETNLFHLRSFEKIEKAFFPNPNYLNTSKLFIESLKKDVKANFTYNVDEHNKSKPHKIYSKSMMNDLHNVNTMNMTAYYKESIKQKPFSISSSFKRKITQNNQSSDNNMKESPEVCISKNFTSKEDSRSPNYIVDSFSSIFNSANNMVYNFGNTASNSLIKFNFLDSFSKKFCKNLEQKPSNSLAENSIKISLFTTENDKSPFNLVKHKLNNGFSISSKRERSNENVAEGLNSPGGRISCFGNIKFCNEDSLFNDETKVRKLLKKKRRIHLKKQNMKYCKNRESLLYFEPLEDNSKNTVIHGSFFLYIELEKSFNSDDEEEIQYMNADLKQKFFKYYHFEKALFSDKFSFGENPLNHYENLKELYKIILDKVGNSSLGSNTSEVNEIQSIKASIKFISDNINILPVFKAISNQTQINQGDVKTNDGSNLKCYKCHYCEEIFDKHVSLGGHNKLHSNFNNNDICSSAARQLLETLNLNKELLSKTKIIKFLIRKNILMYSEIYEKLKIKFCQS